MYYFTLIASNRVEAMLNFCSIQRFSNRIMFFQLYLWTLRELFYLYICILVLDKWLQVTLLFLYVMHYCIRTYSTQTLSTLYFINFMFIYSKFHLFWIQQTFDDKQHKQNKALVFFFENVVAVVEMKSFYLYIFLNRKHFCFFSCTEEEEKEWKSI